MQLVITWDWVDEYALRNTLYPLYLSLPLHILRRLSIDTNFLVVNSMLFMNSLLQLVGDYYLYKLAKQFLGTNGAKISLVYVLFNATINQIFSKTLTNGAETAFSMAGLYYFGKIHDSLDRNMVKMTFFITLAFIIRSSSIVGWIPLALFKMLSSFSYFVAIWKAAMLVALPTFLVSVGIDIVYYGRLTCPQYNFLKLNVVDNISKYFGIMPWHEYIENLQTHLISNVYLFEIMLVGFCLFAVMQINGEMPFKVSKSERKASRFPSIPIFVVTNLFVLSLIPHKETRFMSQITPLFAIFWATFWRVFMHLDHVLTNQIPDY